MIVRHLRVRPGDTAPGERDAITIRGARRVILDHCSVSWSTDEVLSTTESRDVTVQWCLITEALDDLTHSKGNPGYGSIIAGDGISYQHNLYAHSRSRNPRPDVGLIDFRNNVIYDWDGMAGYTADADHRLNYVGNVLKPGPATRRKASVGYHLGGPRTRTHFAGNLLLPGEGDAESEPVTGLALVDQRKGGELAERPFEVAPVKI